MEERTIVIGADDALIGTGRGQVLLHLSGVSAQLGLAQEFGLALALTPDEADRIALALVRQAALARAQPAPRTSPR